MTAYFEFNDELHQLLLKLDEEPDPELDDTSEPNLDYEDLSRRIEKVKPCLEDVSCYRLIRDDMQDCFYAADLGVWKKYPDEKGFFALYVVTFSYLGRIATVTANYPGVCVSMETKKKTAECLEKYGFVFVDSDILDNAKYDGKREWFLNNGASWADRLFGCS